MPARIRRTVTTATPWGRADDATTYARGVVCYSTPSHGGFHLSAARQAAVPACLRRVGGWYEEDCEWVIVAHVFPDLFTATEVAGARTTLQAHWPDQWREVTGEEVPVTESHVLRERAFYAAHAGDWVAVAASGDWHPDARPGYCVVTAAVGGRGPPGVVGVRTGPTRRYLVPTAEYHARGLGGFVIDLARHEEVHAVMTLMIAPESIAAVEGPEGREEAARLLRQVAASIEGGDAGGGDCRDINGNCVGRWAYTPGEAAE